MNNFESIGLLFEDLKESSEEEYNPEKYYINLKNAHKIKEDQHCQNESNETDTNTLLKDT